MFDTHCHLNFKIFNINLDQVITDARTAGIDNIVIPGTNIESSKKAVEIAQKYDGVYASVGIHPHHVFDMMQIQSSKLKVKNYNLNFKIEEIEKLLSNSETSGKIVAIGEIGLDKHQYQKTKYGNYQVTDQFLDLQNKIFIKQLKLAVKYKKAVIIHNRKATEDILKSIADNWLDWFSGHMVFHCCEPILSLLQYAKEKSIYIGVDGDITYRKDKQDFIKKVPLELLVLETDSPFLSPRITKNKKQFPNEPKNIPLIAEYIAKLSNQPVEKIKEIATTNAKKLFQIDEN